ncbi:MAG: DUF29 domain-containing protein, partial [Aquificaceae bacterium]
MGTMSKEELKELYEKDFPLWVEENLKLLREKAYELVDWENLLEEIEDMGLRYLDSCVSHLAVVLENLYKWDNFKELIKTKRKKVSFSWIKNVENARDELELLFYKYPSLKARLPQEVSYAWKQARVGVRKWLRKLSYDPEEFDIPKECPYTYEEA